MPRVTALILDGGGRVGHVLDAVAAQTRPPDETRRFKDLDEAAGFGEPGDWIWLLDASATPHPDALRRLLGAVETAPSVAVAGCKQVRPADEALLVDVGYTTSRAGAVVTGIELNEVDQGQYDDRSDVMAVRLPGALVRADVWCEVGPPTPTLDEPAAGLEFCRQVRLAGHRVVVVPAAVVERAPAIAATAMNRSSAVHLRLARARWALLPLVMFWTLLAAPPRALWRLLVKQPRRAVEELTAPVSALLNPGAWRRARRRARQLRRVPLGTLSGLDARPAQVWRQRRDDLITFVFWAPALDAPDRPAADRPSDPAGDPSARPTSGRGHGPSPSLPLPPVGRRAAALGAVLLALAVVSAIALRRALPWGAPQEATGLAGPALVPVPDSWRDLWDLFATPWRPVGLGADAVADSFTGVLAALAFLVGGSPAVAVDLLVLGALPLAALSAWVAAGALTRSVALRGWAALAWAAAPSLLVAVGDGRLGAVLAHVVLPLFVVSLARSVGYGRTGRPSLTAAAAAALTATLVLAGAPSLAIPVAALLVVAAVAARAGRWLPLLVGTVPLFVLWPWWATVAGSPRLLLADPSSPAVPGPEAAAPWWNLLGLPSDPAALLGSPRGGPDGMIQQWARYLPDGVAGVSAPVAVICAIAVSLVAAALVVAGFGLFGRRHVLVAVALGAGLVGLEIAVIAARVDVGAIPAGSVRGWSGAGVSWFTLAALTGAVVGVRGLRRRSVARLAGAVLAVTPIVLLGGWAWHGWTAGVGVHRVDPVTVPEVSALEADGPAATRTLVLRLDESAPAGITWAVQRFAGPRLGADSAAASHGRRPGAPASDAAMAARTTETELVTPLLGALIADAGEDVRPRLASLAIGSIQVLPPVDDRLAQSLDASPGLVRSGRVQGSVVWRVDLPSANGEVTRPARARIVGQDGAVQATVQSSGTRVEGDVASGPAGRRVVLAESADRRWQATYAGASLTPEVYDGWSVAFTLPAQAGHLVIDEPSRLSAPVRWAQGAVLVFVLLLAVPVPRIRRRVGAPPRASRSVPRLELDERHGARPRGAELASDEAAERWVTPPAEEEREPVGATVGGAPLGAVDGRHGGVDGQHGGVDGVPAPGGRVDTR